MMIAAIVFAAGVMVELYAVALAPLGYQDDNGFHVARESKDEVCGRIENPS
jgi:hypothetical protein